jgi:hypothetical protein
VLMHTTYSTIRTIRCMFTYAIPAILYNTFPQTDAILQS